MMRAARRMADYIGFEPDTGCLAANRPEGAVTPYGQTPLDMDTAKALIHQLNDGNLSGEEHVKQLVDKLDMAILEKGQAVIPLPHTLHLSIPRIILPPPPNGLVSPQQTIFSLLLHRSQV